MRALRASTVVCLAILTVSSASGAVSLIGASSISGQSLGSARRLAEPYDDMKFIGVDANVPAQGPTLEGGTSGHFRGLPEQFAGATQLEAEIQAETARIAFSVSGYAEFVTEEFLGSIGSNLTAHAMFDLNNLDPSDQTPIAIELFVAGRFVDAGAFGLFDSNGNEIAPGMHLLAPGQYEVNISASLLAGITAARSFDSFSGSAVFSVLPSPAAAIALGIGGLLAGARRRR